MKKKVLAITAACAMASLSLLTACDGKSKIKPEFVMPEGGFNMDKQVEITFYHNMGQSKQTILDRYIAQFNESYPNIKVTYPNPFGGYEDIRDTITTEITTGDQPNIAYCYPDHVALYNRSNAVLPLNDFLPDGAYKDMKITDVKGKTTSLGFDADDKNAFFQNYYEEGYKFDDESKMYTLPFAKSTELMYYNKTYFENNDLKVPATWDDMEKLCVTIKGLSPDKTPFGYDSEANWFITMCEQYGSEYTSSTGNKYRFDNKTNRDFVTKFKGWYDKGYFTTQAINGSYTSTAFKEQKIFMCIGSSAGASYQRVSPDTKGNYAFEVGVAPIPQVDAANPKSISQGPSVCIFKNEDPQKVLASWLFTKFLTTNVDFQAEFSFDSGYAPVIRTVTENQTYQNGIKMANGYAYLVQLAVKTCLEQDEKSYFVSPAFVGSSKARDEVGQLIQAVCAGTDVSTAFKNAVNHCEYFAPSQK